MAPRPPLVAIPEVSNTRYFVFNLIYFRIKSSISCQDSSIRYFIFKIFDLSILYIFLKTSFFITSLSLIKPTGTGTNLSILIYLLYFSNYLNQFVLFLIYQYLIYKLQILSLLNQPLQQILMYQQLLPSLDMLLIHYQINLIQSLPAGDFGSEKYLPIYIISFLPIHLLKELSQFSHVIYSLSPFLFITFSTLNSFLSVFCNSFQSPVFFKFLYTVLFFVNGSKALYVNPGCL